MKKKFRFIVLFIVIAIIFISVDSFASSDFHIFSVTRTKETETIEINLNIPVIIGFNNKIIQKKYNKIIRNDIFDFSVKAQKEVDEYRKEALKHNFPFHQCSIFVDYKVYKKEKGFLSMVIEFYKFTGGAHGITELKSYNIDMSKGMILTLSDYLKRVEIDKAHINNIIENKIDNEPDKYFSGKMKFKSVGDDQGFYLKENKLIVFFQLYEIAPYASGFPEFVIPLKKYK